MVLESSDLELDVFPASLRHHRSSLALPSLEIEDVMNEDLSVSKLDALQDHLWLAGLPYLPRPLNIQNVLGRAIIPTTDASLHLVWTSKRIFLRTIPSYILSETFFDKHLKPPQPNGLALGLLHTYFALVPTELDFQLARETKLIPGHYSWNRWRTLTRRVLEAYPDRQIYDKLPERYQYGELRLGRLNVISRIFHGDWLHGYTSLTGYSSYVKFFSGNLGLIAAATVYIVVVLTAMQVGLITQPLKNNHPFQRASYGFAVFSIISPIIGAALIMSVFMVMFVANLWRTLRAQRAHRQGAGVSKSSRWATKVDSGQSA